MIANTMSARRRLTSVPSGMLIHPAVWRQQTWAENWGDVPLWGGGLGPYLKQCSLGRGLPLCQVSSDSSNRLATIYQRYRQTTVQGCKRDLNLRDRDIRFLVRDETETLQGRDRDVSRDLQPFALCKTMNGDVQIKTIQELSSS